MFRSLLNYFGLRKALPFGVELKQIADIHQRVECESELLRKPAREFDEYLECVAIVDDVKERARQKALNGAERFVDIELPFDENTKNVKQFISSIDGFGLQGKGRIVEKLLKRERLKVALSWRDRPLCEKEDHYGPYVPDPTILILRASW